MPRRSRIIASRLLVFALPLAPVCAQAAWLTLAQVRAQYVSSYAYLTDRNGEPLQQVRLNPKIRRLSWTPLSEMSPALKAAVLASEDKRFYEHGGVDWAALGAATMQNLFRDRKKPTRGASTITMQLAALLDPKQLGQGGKRSLGQKWAQTKAAAELERIWKKDEILEAYLNLSTFRGEIVGVRAAAEVLFDKSPDALNRTDAMLLAVLLRGPNASPSNVGKRACLLAQSVDPKARASACAELERAAQFAFAGRNALALRYDKAPHLAARFLNRADQAGVRLQSSLRADLQEVALDALARHLEELVSRQVEDGAIVVLDNASGDVLAYVGSSGARSRAQWVDGASALRQAGSTLKPFLYQLALEREWLTAASLIDDSPVNLATPVGVYLPQNYDRSFKGWVSARTALASSLNVPAVRTLLLVTPDLFHQRLVSLGFDSLKRDADYYGYALALGGADVTLLALTNAYRTLANAGLTGAVRYLADDPTAGKKRVLPAGATFIVADMLSDPVARALTFGFDSPLVTRVWSAVKTGTSKDMRDNWCVGFTSRYTVGVWVGNFSGAPMHEVSGVSGAAPIWHELIEYLHRKETSVPPRAPAELVRARVEFDDQVEAAREEWFLPRTVMTRSARAGESGLDPKIAYPGEGTIIALDPDIPPDRQRVEFIAQPVRQGVAWLLDGQVLGNGSRVDWAPTAGRHTLALELEGREVARVQFEVRGTRN